MSTEIDSILISIESSDSSSAIGNIRDLAGALEGLKKNGSIGTVTKNLKALATELQGLERASVASRNLGKIAGGIERLKSVGSVAAISNSLKKLKENLSGLDNIDIDRVAPQLERVAAALGPLSAVKAGGINTMMNGLQKLGKVTKELDDDKIAAFAEKVKKLNDVLAPLSEKMTTIGAGFKGVNSVIRTTSRGTQELGSEVNATTLNMASMITVAQGIVAALQPVIRLLTETISAAIEWDGIAARFGRGFGDQAQETYAWIQRLNEEMGINVQQFMQYSSVYATMLTGFGVAMEDAGKMALGYTELTYDIWAGYNDVYNGFADAAEAVKSAIAGEVEPIRRAGFTIVEATLEQTAANYGLEISLEKATEAQKSYLRYLTLVDQAQAQGLVGTYAKELNTAEGLMRTFSQQLKSLAQAFGSLFLPVLVKVMPYVQAFVELLTEAVALIAGFFGIEIQPVSWESSASGIGSVGESADAAAGSLDDATKAAKELKNATLGIDELNVISPQTNSGGGGGGSGGASGFDGLDVDSLWDESIFDSIQSKVDEIKDKFKDWLPIIETIGGVLAGLGIASLLQQMGEAISQMTILNKLLSSVAIVAIEAALVFSFADNYLEDGNLLYLIGQALVTAAGSYLLFKAWGPTGAILGLSVSIVAQLVAITMNLADGGVTMDDPELWIQSAFTTALAGAGGGLLAYKNIIKVGTGKGVGLGLLVGLSLTLAAITIGDIAADGKVTAENILTGLGSVVSAAGFGFMIGGPTGAAIGAAVALTVNIVGAIVGEVAANAETDLQKDLESRFGKVEVSVEEARVIISKLVPEWAEGVNQAVELRKGVENLIKNIETQEGALGNYEWQVAVGIALTEADNKHYRAAIDSFVESCQSYISERGYALEVGLSATTSTASIIESANSVSSIAGEELAKLGKQLQDTVNAAYEDGLLDVDELEAIQNIRNDMREIVNALNTSEIEAELEMLKMSWSGVELTPESFNNMMKEWDDTIQKEVKPALESTVKENLKTLKGNIAYLELAIEKDPGNESLKVELEKAKKAYQDYIDENPLENMTLDVVIDAVNFALNTLRDAYAKEIEEAKKAGWFDYTLRLEEVMTVEPGFKFDEGNGDIYGNIELLYGRIQNIMESESYNISKTAREGIAEMVESMKPTVADLEEIATANHKAGATVTGSVRSGLNDYNEMAALTGDIDAINYVIGKGFSTDETFLNTLATSENAGEQVTGSVRKGLLTNIDYVKDEASGLVVGIKNAITGETTYITPTLEKNMSQMGVTLGDALGGEYKYVYDETTGVLKAITNSVTGNKVWVNDELEKAGKKAGSELSNGVLSGAKAEMKADEKSWLDWAIWPWNWFKKKNEINSPSKLFERGGKAVSDGLIKGVPTNGFKDKISKVWTTAWNWWKNDKKPMSSYTPSIGSIYEKVYDRWKNARDWYHNKKPGMKTYTPSIGSIKDKVVSAWNTAFKWWKSNAKLSTKLDIKVPKITVKWDTAEAFGKSFKYPTGFKLSFAADGGIFKQGSLIWAGEHGAEIAASAPGGRTGVMNVQQMQDAVYEGVYAAMAAAMRSGGESGGEMSVNVYLDGRQISRSVEKSQKERGASIMGNQVMAY